MSYNLSIFKTFKKPYVLILCGPPLSGKSTFSSELKEKIDNDVVIINRDSILLSLHHNDNYDEAYKSVNEKAVNKLLREQMMDANANLKSVIIDMCHTSPKRRIGNLSYFSKRYYKAAVVFPILDEAEYKRRNDIRILNENKSISNGVMKQMMESYKSVQKSEGYDKIIYL